MSTNHTAAIDEKIQAIKSFDEQLLSQNETIANLRELLSSKDEMIKNLHASNDQAAKDHQEQLAGRDELIKNLNAAKDRSTKDHREQLASKDQAVKDMEISKNEEIATLRSDITTGKETFRYLARTVCIMSADSCRMNLEQMNDNLYTEMEEVCEECLTVQATGGNIRLPSLRFANAQTKHPVVLAVNFWVSIRLADAPNDVNTHAQSVFNAANDMLPLMPWIRGGIQTLAVRMSTLPQTSSLSRMFSFVLQGIVLVGLTTPRSELLQVLVDGVANVARRWSSPCLMFMVEQLQSFLANPDSPLTWLSGYQGREYQLDSSNSSLAQGTRLIVDGDSLFFVLVSPNDMSLFTDFDVSRVQWDSASTTGRPLTLFFREGSYVHERSVLMSIGAIEGPAFDWTVRFLGSQTKVMNSLRDRGTS
ncbi:MAG: hypothetical protein LQ346_001609 [Caloplaca aetnensis]|nr:MAG: hypothetical protein LQ346_001609 [Caloplaca aetnensis]